jgi:hypothetical protein
VKITGKMIKAAMDTPRCDWVHCEECTADAVRAALKDVPDVEPFTFAGYRGHVTVIHSPCGTVETYDPATTGPASLSAAIAEGLCDCENTSPWLRIYVEKRADLS